MKIYQLLCASLLVIGSSASLEAAAINYSISGFASGTLGGQAFADQTITFSGISDTTTAMPYTNFTLDPATATLQIGNSAPVQIFNPVALVSNTFSDNVGLSYYDAATGAAGGALLTAMVGDGSYVLTTDYGPVTGSAFSGLYATIRTSGGDLSYVLSSGIATYTARIGPAAPPIAAVPEPATWAMMICGIGIAGGAMRRRRGTVATTVRFA